MTAPRIIVRYFDEGQGHWTRFARVLETSAARHCPDWVIDIHQLSPSDLYSPSGRQGDVHNTRKLDAWADAVEASPDGDRLLLLDADTLILRSLDDVWQATFDLAYTIKPEGARCPFNGGAMFLRVSPSTRAFVRQWQQVTRHFLTTPRDYDVWRPAHVGISQSALGMLLASNDAARPARFQGWRHGLVVHRLPCVEWNCEDESWAAFDPDRTRILHVKGELQRALLGKQAATVVTAPLLAIWRAGEHAEKPKPLPPDNQVAEIERIVVPSDLDDQMVRPEDVESPEPPPLSRRQRRRAVRERPAMGDAP